MVQCLGVYFVIGYSTDMTQMHARPNQCQLMVNKTTIYLITLLLFDIKTT